MAPSIETNALNATAATSKSSSVHPFTPLSASEIKHAAQLIRSEWPERTELQFKVITLEEPPKSDVIPILESEAKGETFSQLERRAFVNYYLRNTSKFHEAIVNLSSQKVESNVRLGANVHGAGDGAELVAIEKIALEDAGVQEALAKLQLPQGSVVVCDPWIYGSDGVNDDERMYQCFLYLRAPEHSDEPDSNHYAFPLALSPVISTETMKVIRVDYCPTGADFKAEAPKPFKPRPANEYMPEHQDLRKDLKPLQIVQPEGASFKVTQQGNSSTLEWQKWTFRVGFNQREGTVLYNVRYDGRSIFYRVSLSDMNIPYADPRHPFHKKSAFDLGDIGAGLTSNNLKLGCDCLGSIHYLSGQLSTDTGDVQDMENVICIHEQDGGIGWKHTNYRTNRAAIARSRELVIQSILTVANYEYILAYIFNQAGEMHYEVRATGVLSTQPIDEDLAVPWGTVVHPGVLAPHHQHFFSLRVDPAIDGHANRLVYSEAHAMPLDPSKNPHGNGYTTQETVLTHSGGYDTDFAANRFFKIQNAAIRNPVNGLPVAYKIHLPPFQPMLSDVSSFNHKRAEFADRAIYAVSHRDGSSELYAGGRYTNQSRGGTGVRGWAARKDDIKDKDLVLFVQFGINHIPRIEDFPVMPCEVIKVSFKPVNFFTKNPALDVPPSEQGFNRSTLLSGAGPGENGQPIVEGRVGEGVTVTNGNGNGHTATNGNGNGACCSNGH